MDKNYSKYTLEDFTQDKNFIHWVNTGLHSDEWHQFMDENPQFRKDIEVARKIISVLKLNPSAISEEEIYEGWKNVEHFYNLYHKKRRKLSFKKYFRYAAIFLFALVIGATIPYFYFKPHKNQPYSDIIMPSDISEAKLILSDGDEIILRENQNVLQFDTKGGIKINNERIKRHIPKSSKSVLSQLVLPFGMIKSDILLSDGTRVWLNAGSTLLFPHKFEGKERKVILKGEAYFEVAENKNSPFVVNANEIDVAVLGTKFNLKNNANDDELEVVLVEGSVSLKENNRFKLLNKEIKLEPKQRAVYNKTSNKTEVSFNVDTDYYTSWKDGLLMFNLESIVTVFKRLSRFYNVQFITETNVELYRKISGKLDLTGSLEDVLKVVSDAAPISYRIENDIVYVSEKK